MQKRYIPITVFVALLAVVAIIGYLIPNPAQSMPERILLDNAAGKVVFNHQQHARDAKIACQTCHHESTQQRDTVQSCGSCHGPAFDENFRKNHAERFTVNGVVDKAACATCHHVEFAPKVKWSHKAHAEEYGVECRSCHHKDTNIEPEPQNCADCHQRIGDKDMPSIRTAVHTKCQSCHEDMFAKNVKGCAECHTKVESRTLLTENKFAVTPLYANCATCHVEQKTQDLVPGRMAAFHGQCIKCHETTGKGPFTKDQCNQCHTK